MSAIGRRIRQALNSYRHLAKICGKNVTGGRPVYKKRTLGSIHSAIAAERAQAAAEQRRKVKKK